MISNIVKIEKEKDCYVLFNKRGMVLELSPEEYSTFKKYGKQKNFPKRHREFFNKLCNYEMTDFQDYQAKDAKKDYSKRLLHHDSADPVFKAPIIAHLGITQRCNMRCRYCSVREPYESMKELSTEEWKKIIKNIAELGVFQIGFTGGEPTLREDLIELAEYVNSLNCTFNLTTNCWHLSEEMIAKLKKAGMRQCQVSLDSHLPEVNDKLRTEGSCKNVQKAIRLLRKHNITVGIDCVVSNNNIRHIESFVEWLGKENVPFLTLIKIKQGDLALSLFKELLPPYEKYSRLIEKLCSRENKNPNITIDCGSVSNLQYSLKEEDLHKIPVAGCPAGHTLLSISPNGDMYPCVALGQDEFKIGNALKDDLKKLWQKSKVLRELRQVKSKVSGKCRDCDRLDYCRGGCRGIAYSLYHNLWEADKTCRR